MKPPEDATEAVVVFHPELWIDERAVSGDEPKATFTVPIDEATDENGDLVPDSTGLSDDLKWHDNAPEWVQEWPGPFYVTIPETQ